MAKAQAKGKAINRNQRKPPQQQQQSRRTQSTGSGMKKIGALWLKHGKQTFMSGRVDIGDENEMSILVFKNGYKEQDNQPDYIIYEPTEQRRNNPRQQEQTEDDIPF